MIPNVNAQCFSSQGSTLVQHWSIVSARRKSLCHRDPSNTGDTVVRCNDAGVWLCSLFKLWEMYLLLSHVIPFYNQVNPPTFESLLDYQGNDLVPYMLMCCRLLSGVKKHFIFQHHDAKVSVRNNVVVTHLTSVSSKCDNSLYYILINVSSVCWRKQSFLPLCCRTVCALCWSISLCTGRRCSGCRSS